MVAETFVGCYKRIWNAGVSKFINFLEKDTTIMGDCKKNPFEKEEFVFHEDTSLPTEIIPEINHALH